MIKQVRMGDKYINQGKQGCPTGCPVALALRDLIAPDVNVFVQKKNVRFVSGLTGREALVPMPELGSFFVTLFDYWGKRAISNCEFQLDIPEEFLNEDSVS